MRAQRAIVRRRARDRIGQTDVVLLERCLTGTGADRGWVGRSAAEAPEVDGGVRVRAGPDARAGDFVRVRYTAAAGYDMEAVALAARGRPEA
jgi:tRNA A37 methylthiotransferase MiaB